jgi:predicted transcriptional regulator
MRTMKRTSKTQETVTEVLRRAIEECGETLYRVAKDAGVPYATLYRFMKSKRSLSGPGLDKLCAYLGLTLTKK